METVTIKYQTSDEHCQQLVEKIHQYLPSFNQDRFLKAYEFAREAHGTQRRKSGELYIEHPLQTAKILTELRADETTLLASLLHDVPEDTNCSLEEIEMTFGQEICFLVDAITKLSKVHYQHQMEERQIASLKKMLLQTTKDRRVILIKLADRLHNMRTLQAVPERKKRLRIAKETWEIYVPMANLLGLTIISEELKDLCFGYLYPRHYRLFKKRLEITQLKQEEILEKLRLALNNTLAEHGLKAYVTTKLKLLSKIFQKTQLAGKESPDLEDMIEVEVMVETIPQCYQFLGILHQKFKPKAGQIEDYIAVRRPDGFYGLKTVVFGIDKIVTDFKIQTREMYLSSRYGLVADHFLETSSLPLPLNQQNRPWWAERILDLENELKDNKKFLEELKLDVFHDHIFTFTPKGAVIDLPAGSNCIDFAYAIHTTIGHHALKAQVNQKIVPLSTILHEGDIVYIIQDPAQLQPHRMWLDLVRTKAAKNKIKEYFRKESRENKIKIGHDILEKEGQRVGSNLISMLYKNRGKLVLKSLNCQEIQELFIKLADGSLLLTEVLRAIYDCFGKKNSLEKTVTTPLNNHKRLYRVGAKVLGHDHVGLAKAILDPFVDMGINIAYIHITTRFLRGGAVFKLSFDVHNFEELRLLLRRIAEVEGVIQVERTSPARVLAFYSAMLVAFCTWILHPFMIKFLISQRTPFASSSVLSTLLFFIGFYALFKAIFLLKELSAKTFPEWKNTRLFWLTTFVMINFATLTIVFEIFLFDVQLNWFVAFALLLIVYLNFLVDYQKIRQDLGGAKGAWESVKRWMEKTVGMKNQALRIEKKS